MTNSKRYLVWLDWPEECFRANASDIKHLKTLVGTTSSIVRVKSESAFLKELPKATHVLTWHFKKAWYEKARAMQLLATPAAGRELIEGWQEAPDGVKVHFGGFHGSIIAESVAAFCLGWARGFFRTPPKSGIWPRSWLGGDCFTVAGTRAVIAGYGKIGKAIGEKLSQIGIEVEGFTRKNIKELPKALKKADWFILALPSDTGTDNFLDAKKIALLPPRAVVVNIGRGNAIDEEALAEALCANRLAGAYLDVFKNEPTQLNPHKESCEGWLFGSREPNSIPNLIKMPHSSAFSPQYIKMAMDELKHEGLI